MNIKSIIYKVRVNICKLLFNDILKDFQECDIELGRAYGFDDGYAVCLEEHNLNK